MQFNYIYLFTVMVITSQSYAQQQQQYEYTTPVPILKQINRQNYDGSYSYGYEAADGTFKLEIKLPSGEVYGKYGYKDEKGQIREIKYGASDRGFEPVGNDINVPPPTLSKNFENYLQYEKPNKPSQLPVWKGQEPTYRPKVNYKPNIIQNQYNEQQPTYQQQQPIYVYNPPQEQYQPKPEYEQYNKYNNYASQNQLPASTSDFYHPALKNLDILTGSYSLDYAGRK